MVKLVAFCVSEDISDSNSIEVGFFIIVLMEFTVWIVFVGKSTVALHFDYSFFAFVGVLYVADPLFQVSSLGHHHVKLVSELQLLKVSQVPIPHLLNYLSHSLPSIPFSNIS